MRFSYFLKLIAAIILVKIQAQAEFDYEVKLNTRDLNYLAPSTVGGPIVPKIWTSSPTLESVILLPSLTTATASSTYNPAEYFVWGIHYKTLTVCLWQSYMAGLENFAISSPIFPWKPKGILTLSNPPLSLAADLADKASTKTIEEWYPTFVQICTEPRTDGGQPYTVVVNVKITFQQVDSSGSITGGTTTTAGTVDFTINAKTPNIATQTCTPMVFGDSNFLTVIEIHTTHRGVEYLKLTNSQDTFKEIGVAPDIFTVQVAKQIDYFLPEKYTFFGFQAYHNSDRIWYLGTNYVQDKHKCDPAPVAKPLICPTPKTCPTISTATVATAPTPAPAPVVIVAATPPPTSCPSQPACTCPMCPAQPYCPLPVACPAPVLPPPPPQPPAICNPAVQMCLDIDISSGRVNKKQGFVRVPYDNHLEFGLYSNVINWATKIRVIQHRSMHPVVQVDIYDISRGDYLNYWKAPPNYGYNGSYGPYPQYHNYHLQAEIKDMPDRESVLKEFSRRIDEQNDDLWDKFDEDRWDGLGSN